MSKVVRLNDEVLEKLNKVADYMKNNQFEDDPTLWHMIFDNADENFYIHFILSKFIDDKKIK